MKKTGLILIAMIALLLSGCIGDADKSISLELSDRKVAMIEVQESAETP